MMKTLFRFIFGGTIAALWTLYVETSGFVKGYEAGREEK